MAAELTVKKYYKNFISIYGAITILVGAIPFLGFLLPDRLDQYSFPPLGDATALCRSAALIAIVTVTIFVFFCKDAAFVGSKTGRIKALSALAVILVIGIFAVLASYSAFVRSVNIADKGDVVVSIGYERTPFAKATFADSDDYEMLRDRGPTEEGVAKLWVRSSVLTARCALLAAYLVVLLPALAIGSLTVLFDLIKVSPPQR